MGKSGRAKKVAAAKEFRKEGPVRSDGEWLLNYINTEEADNFVPVPSPVPFRARQTKWSRRFQLNSGDGFLSTGGSAGTGYIQVHPQVADAVNFTSGTAEPESTDQLGGWFQAIVPKETAIGTVVNMDGGQFSGKCKGHASADAAWDNVVSLAVESAAGCTVIFDGVMKNIGKTDVIPQIKPAFRFYSGGVWGAWILAPSVASANPDWQQLGVVIPAATTRVAFGWTPNVVLSGDIHPGASWSFTPTVGTLGCGNDALKMQTFDAETILDVPDLTGWRCTGLSVRVFQTGTLTKLGGTVVGCQVPNGYTMDDDPISSLSRYPVDRYIGSFNDMDQPGLHMWWRPQSLDDFELNTQSEPHRASSYIAIAFDVVELDTTVNVQVDMLFDYQSYNQLHVGALTPSAHDLYAYLHVLAQVPVASCNAKHKDKGLMARALAKSKSLLGRGADWAIQHPEQVVEGLAMLAAL